jgi:peptidoglycan hydrolase CwlO-like protein
MAVGIGAARPTIAWGDTLDDLEAKVEQTNDELTAANDKVAQLQQQIDDNQQRISEIEAQLPDARAAAAQSIRAQYKMQQGSQGLVELILSSDSFYDFLSTIQFLDSVTSYNTDQIQSLVDLTTELSNTQSDLNTQLSQAETERQNAQDALDSAVAAREALQQQMAEEQAAQEAEAQAALQEAAQSEGQTFQTESGNTATVEVPQSSSNSSSDSGNSSNSGSSSENVNWQSDKDSFVSQWGARIDAYLAGSPLAGYGSTFAAAAWDYGIDPRLSPAISAVESSKGLYCAYPHNAWGWGNVSWSSWETAIYAHTAGLASGYGGYLTYAMAQKYCPPNSSAWYSSVAANMAMI